jgi:hypothetical protein
LSGLLGFRELGVGLVIAFLNITIQETSGYRDQMIPCLYGLRFDYLKIRVFRLGFKKRSFKLIRLVDVLNMWILRLVPNNGQQTYPYLDGFVVFKSFNTQIW